MSEERVKLAIGRWLATGDPLWSAARKFYALVASHCYHKTILDLGCGCGMGTAVLGQYNEVLGVDLELEAIHFARGFYPWIPFWCNDVTTVALPKVDVVVAIEMLEHVTDASAVAARLAKLAPTIWLSTPNRAGREQLHDHRHVREYYPDEIREMFPAFDCAAVLEAEGSVLYRMELDL